ncbi:hypothetical protein C8R34_10399 [Nitrosomonas sp. Nm84]|uniref:hypothetical protein n=1 Tax=Nitrosomonas sp. Nm84 TaxID=200124 RepID=UPI000D772CC2|nr:hypothetical protein [Nitrosomonas sp. Nm84]PXW89942.1 hypothetical protein C8R34_10399 [Nitrosomonas sp. Nm84]
MSKRIKVLAMLAMVTATVGLFLLPQLALADGNCKNLKGNLSVVNNFDGTTSGTITGGEKLNGTTRATFSSTPIPTPDASTISYIDNFSVTTQKGILATSNVAIYDTGRGLFSEIARIVPDASTGDFAGATGVLFISGQTTDGGATFQAGIEGEICFISGQ